MMHPLDVFVLARTKLRSHQVRTSITVAIAGLLFGVIVAAVTMTQGIFSSVASYSSIGLNNRTIMTIGHSSASSSFDVYNHTTDPAFVAEVEAAYNADIANKQRVAKKYSVEYDAASSNPSPIGIDPETKQQVITNDGAMSELVQRLAQEKRNALGGTFSITEYLRPYKSVTLRYMQVVQPANGALAYMKNGSENQQLSRTDFDERMAGVGSGASLTILDGSVARPFVTVKNFDPTKGEIPVVFPYLTAEKLLQLPSLSKDASPNERRERMRYVRAHVGDITAFFCYRNEASRALMQQAVAQQDDIKRAAGSEDYIKPTLLYSAPNKNDCAGVTVESDTRSAAEKQSTANREAFEKEVGIWAGDPVQYKVIVRGVGVSGDNDIGASTVSVNNFVTSLLNSTLGFGTWSVPKDLFDKLPEAAKPAEVFSSEQLTDYGRYSQPSSYESYLAEFGDKTEARALLERTGVLTGSIGNVTAFPFGSGTLFIDEMRTWVERILFWMLMIVGVIAVLILWGIIGRTIADSRRESAVFRAVGATRLDIATVYGVYSLLLAFRVVIFAAVLGGLIAFIIDRLLTVGATLGAQLAYAAVDTDIQFHFFSVLTWNLPLVFGVILLAGVVASIVPIVLASRRNPITDMRDDA